MKKLLTTLCLALATAGMAAAQEAGKDGQMKAWETYMTPSAIHKMMAKSDGTWKTESTVWMDPAAAPIKSTGTCTNKMILGGRYQESSHKSTMMGMPFEGKGTLAYDNAKKLFITTWIDNMGTGLMTLTGTWDETSKSIHFSGTMVDPTSGQDLPVREVLTMKDDNHQVMQMFMTAGGQEMKTMEINLSRSGKKG